MTDRITCPACHGTSRRCGVTIAFTGGCVFQYGHADGPHGLEDSPHLSAREAEGYSGWATQCDLCLGAGTIEVDDTPPATDEDVAELRAWALGDHAGATLRRLVTATLARLAAAERRGDDPEYHEKFPRLGSLADGAARPAR